MRAASLTIEPCAVVRIQEGFELTVGGTAGAAEAALVVRGKRMEQADGSVVVRPVSFMPDTDGTHWGALRALPTGRIDLEHALLRGGGEQSTAQNFGGTVIGIGGDGPDLDPLLRFVDVTIEDSGGLGVNLQSFAAFTEVSDGLTVRGSGQQAASGAITTDSPILIAPPAAHTVPRGAYTGNALDEIIVFNQGLVRADEAFAARGVPYRMSSAFSMSSQQSMAEGGELTLTIEAGVTIKFVQTPGNVWSMALGTSNGALPENLWPVRLIADGTAAAPIVLTSAADAPAAGDWGGIEWAAAPSSGNVMNNVRVEYAGGDSGNSGFGCGPTDNDAALIIRHWRPDDDFIDNVSVVDSQGGGIVCGWISDEDGPDLKGGSVFTNIGNGCEVARWQNETSPSCPGNDSVPDCL